MVFIPDKSAAWFVVPTRELHFQAVFSCSIPVLKRQVHQFVCKAGNPFSFQHMFYRIIKFPQRTLRKPPTLLHPQPKAFRLVDLTRSVTFHRNQGQNVECWPVFITCFLLEMAVVVGTKSCIQVKEPLLNLLQPWCEQSELSPTTSTSVLLWPIHDGILLDKVWWGIRDNTSNWASIYLKRPPCSPDTDCSTKHLVCFMPL